MSDSTRLKAMTILGIIGAVVAFIVISATQDTGGNAGIGAWIIGRIILALIGFLAGASIVSIPIMAGWLWGKLAGFRNLSGITSVIGAVIWFVVMFYTVWVVAPIITIYKFVTLKRSVKYDKEVELAVEQEQIESKSEDWRDHF